MDVLEAEIFNRRRDELREDLDSKDLVNIIFNDRQKNTLHMVLTEQGYVRNKETYTKVREGKYEVFGMYNPIQYCHGFFYTSFDDAVELERFLSDYDRMRMPEDRTNINYTRTVLSGLITTAIAYAALTIASTSDDPKGIKIITAITMGCCVALSNLRSQESKYANEKKEKLWEKISFLRNYGDMLVDKDALMKVV